MKFTNNNNDNDGKCKKGVKYCLVLIVHKFKWNLPGISNKNINQEVKTRKSCKEKCWFFLEPLSGVV